MNYICTDWHFFVMSRKVVFQLHPREQKARAMCESMCMWCHPWKEFFKTEQTEAPEQPSTDNPGTVQTEHLCSHIQAPQQKATYPPINDMITKAIFLKLFSKNKTKQNKKQQQKKNKQKKTTTLAEGQLPFILYQNQECLDSPFCPQPQVPMLLE